MKIAKIIALVCAMFFCVTVAGAKNTEKVVFKVEQMSTTKVQKEVTKILNNVDGVKDIETNLKNRSVTISYNENKTNSKKLKSALEKKRFTVTNFKVAEVSSIKEITFKVDQLTTSKAEKEILEVLRSVAGVKGLDVEFRKHTVTINYDANITNANTLKNHLERRKYKVTPVLQEQKKNKGRLL